MYAFLSPVTDLIISELRTNLLIIPISIITSYISIGIQNTVIIVSTVVFYILNHCYEIVKSLSSICIFIKCILIRH